MPTEEHCGYANYETFSVANLIDGNLTSARTYREINALVDDVIDRHGRECETLSVHVHDALRGYVERHLRPVTEGGGLAGDLISGVLSDRVDWRELAHRAIGDHDERTRP